MNATASGVLDGVLGLVSIAYPPAAPFIAIARTLAPYAIAAAPLLKSAIAEGPAAFAAAKAKAPEFFRHLGDFASQLKGAPANDNEIAALAAHVVGVDPPGWTHEETQRWWDRANPAA